MARRGGGGGYQLSEEERALLEAQAEQARGETAATQEKMRLAAQELGLRQQTEAREAATAQAESQRRSALAPYEQLATLSRAGEPDVQERMNRIRMAVDLMGQRQQGDIAAQRLQAERDIEEKKLAADLENRKAIVAGNVQDALISHLSQRPDVPISVLADALRSGGQPQLADALTGAHAADVEKKAAAFQAMIPSFQQKGKLGDLQSSITDPDVMAKVKPFIDQAQQATTVAPENQTPGYVMSGALKYAPIDLVNQLSALANTTAVPLSNLVNSLVGAPPMQKAPYLPRDYQQAWDVLNQ